jgi:asparagine synthase (glutamine-hydrolysing)
MPEIYDEPFGDSSAIPTYLVSKICKGKSSSGASADAGDELFCGYSSYKSLKRTL